MGAEAVLGAALCPGGNEWEPEHSGKYQPGTEPGIHHQALQPQVPYRMHFPGAETADRGILLPVLVKAYAEAEPLPEKRGACGIGVRGGRKILPENIGVHMRHQNAHGVVVYRNGDTAGPFHPFYRGGQPRPAPLPEDTF